MLLRILPFLTALCFFVPLKSQVIFYSSGIDSAKTQEIYDDAMFAMMNAEPKKFYTLAEQVIKKAPQCFKAKAHCAFQNFQLTKGKGPFRKIAQLALDTQPKDAVDSVYFKILKTKIEDNSAKIGAMLHGLTKSNPSVEAFYLLGNHYVEKNDLKTAHKYFFQAFKIKEDFPPILSILAQTSETLGYENLAFDFLNRYIEALPDNPKSHEIMGNYLAGKGEYGKAVEHFKKAYELDPSYLIALEKAKKLRGRFSKK